MKGVEKIKLNITLYDVGYAETQSFQHNEKYRKAASLGYDFAKERFYTKEFTGTNKVYDELEKLSRCGLNVMLNHVDEGFILWVDHVDSRRGMTF